jgi:hypothetical protein
MTSKARVGLWMGDSFAEISASDSTDGGGDLRTSRWFHPKKSLAEGLRETLLKVEASGGTLAVATSRAEMSVARRQGTEPAALVTAGFETWARFGAPNSSGTPSLRASRAWFPTSPDKIFGIHERVRADGAVERELDVSELEFLVAKLELLKIKEIAIAFLHADRFPSHERAAGEFFRARGFNVVCSSELPGAFDDVSRVRRTVESAFAETLLQDDLASLRSVLDENWKIEFWTPAGVSSTAAASHVRGGVEAALASVMPAQGLAYYFGLEEFLGFKNRAPYVLPVQPTCQIGASEWAFPSWTGVDRGYEPGPMLFGKSHQLTLLDVLFVRDRLNGDIEGFSDRVQAKSSARILETLFTLGKNLAEPGRRAADAKDIAQDLETSFVERLAMDLAINETRDVFVCGPLAGTIVPLLEKRRPDLAFEVDTALSIASAARGGS